MGGLVDGWMGLWVDGWLGGWVASISRRLDPSIIKPLRATEWQAQLCNMIVIMFLYPRLCMNIPTITACISRCITSFYYIPKSQIAYERSHHNCLLVVSYGWPAHGNYWCRQNVVWESAISFCFFNHKVAVEPLHPNMILATLSCSMLMW